MDNMELYNQLKTPPSDALKPIDFGNLRGKSDINPQWRYEALTKALGVCGIGWKFEYVNSFTQELPSGELMVFVQVKLYIKDGAKWSEPIIGWGGDYLIKKDKNGIHGNDEAMKMATTDALGTAAKMLGVAADVYRGIVQNGVSDSKYARRDYAAQNEQKAPQATRQTKPTPTTKAPAKAPQNTNSEARIAAIKALSAEIQRMELTGEEVSAIVGSKINKLSVNDMTTDEIKTVTAKLEEWVFELTTKEG